ATGVDVISSGAMTHSVRALDVGLDMRLGASRAPGTPIAGAPQAQGTVRA
ncbi:MAG: nicotinate-nucleotide diphosphorylase (carboxylating), partial [Micrococcaceae bacterium]|nr:nicotinate-nucleotide diphosphorylase (carboxylating) [Micrococcaceae bacterium]